MHTAHTLPLRRGVRLVKVGFRGPHPVRSPEPEDLLRPGFSKKKGRANARSPGPPVTGNLRREGRPYFVSRIIWSRRFSFSSVRNSS